MTDLTELAIECQRERMKLEQQVKELNKWLDLKSEYIEKLELENKKLREVLEFQYGDTYEYMKEAKEEKIDE